MKGGQEDSKKGMVGKEEMVRIKTAETIFKLSTNVFKFSKFI